MWGSEKGGVYADLTLRKPYPTFCEGTEVVSDRLSAQVKQIKTRLTRKYNSEEAILKKIMKKRIVTTTNTIIEAKKTCNSTIEE